MIQNVAILDAEGKVLNVIVADPDDAELMGKIVESTKIEAHAYQPVTEATGNPSRDHTLVDGVFVNELVEVEKARDEYAAKLAVIEPLLTKTQKTEVETALIAPEVGMMAGEIL